ncbi:MAG: hypothetical protein ACREDC_10320 [Bradyrhizobium sp.]
MMEAVPEREPVVEGGTLMEAVVEPEMGGTRRYCGVRCEGRASKVWAAKMRTSAKARSTTHPAKMRSAAHSHGMHPSPHSATVHAASHTATVAATHTATAHSPSKSATTTAAGENKAG